MLSREGGLTKPARQLMAEVSSEFTDLSKLERAVGIQRQAYARAYVGE